jgi:hypothetical protein
MSVRRLAIGVALVVALFVLAWFLWEPGVRQPRPGETPLIAAAKLGDTKLVEALLERGADAHAVTPEGKNAMDAAMTSGICQVDTVIALNLKTAVVRPS